MCQQKRYNCEAATSTVYVASVTVTTHQPVTHARLILGLFNNVISTVCGSWEGWRLSTATQCSELFSYWRVCCCLTSNEYTIQPIHGKVSSVLLYAGLFSIMSYRKLNMFMTDFTKTHCTQHHNTAHTCRTNAIKTTKSKNSQQESNQSKYSTIVIKHILNMLMLNPYKMTHVHYTREAFP
jgi:hypothetical protein